MRVTYRLLVTKDDDKMIITSPDLPEVRVEAYSMEDAQYYGQLQMQQAVTARKAKGYKVPAPMQYITVYVEA